MLNVYFFHSAEIRQAVRERRVVGSYVAWEKRKRAYEKNRKKN